MTVDDDALEFFNDLSGTLDVQLTEPAQPMENLHGVQIAPATARVAGVSFALSVIDDDDDEEEERELTEEEWTRVVVRAPRIRIASIDTPDNVAECTPADGKAFTVRDLVRAIEAAELAGRGATEWMGGVDVHHVFFEGLEQTESGDWLVVWGS